MKRKRNKQPREVGGQEFPQWEWVRNFANGWTLTVNFSDMPEGEPEESWTLVVDDSGSAAIDRDWFERRSLSLTMGEYGIPEPYTMDSTKRNYSWGASGSTCAVLLTIGAGLLTNATWELLKGIAAAIAERAKEQERELTLDEAEHHAVAALVLQSNTAQSNFKVLAVDVADGRGVVEARAVDSGVVYGVQVEYVGGIPLARVRKRAYE